MHKNDTGQRQSIAELLAAQRLRNTDDALQSAKRSWHRLATHLSPLIGESGFCALYARTKRLACAEFSWLVAAQPASVPALLETLEHDLAGTAQTDTRQVNFRLLEIFTTLLSTLIGEALATQILNSAWIDESDAKNTQEKSK